MVTLFLDPDGALLARWCFSHDGQVLRWCRIGPENFQTKRVHVQFAQPTNETEGLVTNFVPLDDLYMLNSSFILVSDITTSPFRCLRMNLCKPTSKALYCGLRKKFSKGTTKVLSLGSQSVSPLPRTNQFQVIIDHPIFISDHFLTIASALNLILPGTTD